MPLLARAVLAPLAVEVRRGALGSLRDILTDRRISAGGDVAVVVGPGLGNEVSELLRGRLDRAEILTVTGGTFAAAAELGAKLRARAYDAVVGIGGGRTIDTVKYAATQQGLPMVSVATSLAHDGIASPVSVLDREGVSVSYGVHTPLAVVVDLDFVRRSPAWQTRSGVGDALSNLSATADWQLAHEVRGEPLDGLALALARTGAEAVLSHPGGIGDEDFLATLANALVLGGVAMAVAGSSLPCSGGCHEIAHAVTKLYPGAGTHGQQVGLGALFCTYLRDDADHFVRLAAALRRHGLPRTPAELGLTDEQFVEAVTHAPDTRPGRYTILEHLALSRDQIAGKLAGFLRAVARS
ncbi:MAG: iron-containing alcohol dehydrogenase family protein [Micromonosporaceae bacterium]